MKSAGNQSHSHGNREPQPVYPATGRPGSCTRPPSTAGYASGKQGEPMMPRDWWLLANLTSWPLCLGACSIMQHTARDVPRGLRRVAERFT